jgi:hypothetical protein
MDLVSMACIAPSRCVTRDDQKTSDNDDEAASPTNYKRHFFLLAQPGIGRRPTK